MKRSLLVVCAVAIVVAGYVIAAQPWHAVTAQDSRSVPVLAVRHQGSLFPGQEVGADCDFGRRSDSGAFVPGQLLVKDPTGQTVGYSTLIGTIRAADDSAYTCIAEFDLAVPTRGIVSVYFGEELVRTFGDDDFPVGLVDGIYIDIPDN